MEITKEGNKLNINGNIKTIQDVEDIKNEINSIINSGEKEVKINIVDSISITSSLIGYFVKLVKLNGIRLSINIGDNDLYELLADLDLISLFNIHKL